MNLVEILVLKFETEFYVFLMCQIAETCIKFIMNHITSHKHNILRPNF